MELDREFLKKAIVEVYRKSLIEEDVVMQKKTREVLDSTDLTKVEYEYTQFELESLEQKLKQEEFVCYVDGAVDSQSEETRAGAAFVIYSDDQIFYKYQFEIPGKYEAGGTIQNTSSHIAEYQALIMCLRTLRGRSINPKGTKVTVHTDSEVLVGQFYAEYRVTNEIQKKLRKEVFDVVKDFKEVELQWVPREENKIANQLAQRMI